MAKLFFRPVLVSLLVCVLAFVLTYWVWSEFVRGVWMLDDVFRNVLSRIPSDLVRQTTLDQRLGPIDSAFIRVFLTMLAADFVVAAFWFWRVYSSRVSSERVVRRLGREWVGLLFSAGFLALVAGGAVAWFGFRQALAALPTVPLAFHGGAALVLTFFIFWLASVFATPRIASGAVPVAALIWSPFNVKPRI